VRASRKNNLIATSSLLGVLLFYSSVDYKGS